MAVEYGDILLNDNKEIYSTADGDLATGEGRVHQIGAITEAVSGNFRRTPTMASDLPYILDGVSNSRKITSKIIDAMAIDGWRLQSLSIKDNDDNKEILVQKAIKVTDITESLI